MGLDTTHDCWHGAYSAFMRWRTEIARQAGIPLNLMEGFYDPNALHFTAGMGETDKWHVDRLLTGVPLSWDMLKPDPLHALLNHSDCDGELDWSICGDLADRLEQILPGLPEGGSGGHIRDWREKTQRFIDGLRVAHAARENVQFG